MLMSGYENVAQLFESTTCQLDALKTSQFSNQTIIYIYFNTPKNRAIYYSDELIENCFEGSVSIVSEDNWDDMRAGKNLNKYGASQGLQFS